VGNPELEPERSASWDAGVEQSLLNGRALVDVTWFHATLEDEIATVFLPTFESTTVNQAGESERRGWEVTVQARLTPQWALRGTYTWLDATEPDGSREVRRPEHSGSINVNYSFLAGRGNLNLGALINGDQQDLEFVSATPATRVTLGGYTLVNLAVSYRLSERVELFARGDNLLDERYTQAFGYRSPGAAGYLGVRARL
jgi:vitamin B12 transporter